MLIPNIHDTSKLIKACIASSESQPQLSTCREMIDTFITIRFKHYENAIALAMITDELDKLIIDRDKEISFEAGKKADYGNVA